jgi:hypothetical protein
MLSKVMSSGTRSRIGLLGIVILVSGCAIVGPKTDACAGWKPIILAEQSIDGLTEQDAQEILTHNIFGQERGCW